MKHGWTCALTSWSKKRQQAEKRALRRRKLADSNLLSLMKTPVPARSSSSSLVEEGMVEKRPMLIQAPTGLGKTVGVLYPVLKEALSRGQRVVYVTPKNSQHLVAEDAVDRFKESGSRIKSLTITAKSKICFQNEPLCDPDFCEYAKDHYTKVAEQGILDILARKRKLKARVFRDLGAEHTGLPFRTAA